ncbi:unnamed protein product [Bemisia tabaci]|uniref:Kazal-like domain-containing protein n=1 Tax=Bemisia tabaci TaxID=7038 RepID=A0A9P0F152_BEMTA|nr:unnamed protein product [Bemisia tabaci]
MVSDNNGNPMNSRIKSDEVDIFLPDWTDREFKEIQSSEISDFKLDKTITCGIWCFRGKLLQKCANETLFAVLFGILSSMLTASFTYYSATIATVEKRFSIPNVNTAEDRDSKVCQSRTGSCSMVESSFGPQVIMFAAQLSAGVGASLFKTVGPAYLDDNTKQTKTAGMMSLSYLLSEISPFLSFQLSGYCLKRYVTPYKETRLSPTDPKWLGAWWMGLISTYKRLLKRPIVVYYYLANIFFVFGYHSYIYYLPKYMRNIFSIPSSTAATYVGNVGLTFCAPALLLSGFIISKFKPRVRLLSAWNAVSYFIILGGILSLLFIGCPENEISLKAGTEDIANFTTTCNAGCHCDYVEFYPVCHAITGNSYISPCHAGCKNAVSSNEKFSDCTCHSNSVKSGFMSLNKMEQLLDKSVEKQDKSIFMGLLITLSALFGYIPGPIVYGKLLVLLFLSFSCNMAVWFHSKTLRNIYEDEEESQRKDDLSSKRNIDYFSDTNF